MRSSRVVALRCIISTSAGDGRWGSERDLALTAERACATTGPRSIQSDIKVFFGSQANALRSASAILTPSGALKPPISSANISRLIFAEGRHPAILRAVGIKAFSLYSLSSSTMRVTSIRRIQVRVLLVDDDAAIARSIELMLKIEEINVYRTDLGEEGVDLGKIYDYDIILLDLNLPDMSG
jgi:hypothetical protein